MTTTETATCTYCDGAGCGDCFGLDLDNIREPNPRRTHRRAYSPITPRAEHRTPPAPSPRPKPRSKVTLDRDGALRISGALLAIRLTAEQEHAFVASWGPLPSDAFHWQEPDGIRYWLFVPPWGSLVLTQLEELLTEGSSWSDGEPWLLVAGHGAAVALPYSSRQQPASTKVRDLPEPLGHALYELAYANDLANCRRIYEERDENLEPLLPRPPWWASTEDREEPRLLSSAEVATLDAPEPRVQGIGLGEGDVAALYGPTNVGKTFVALDLALSIATGKDWHGHETRQGNVLYLAAEGNKAALGQRVQAWEHQHGRRAGAGFRISDLVEDFTDVRSADEVYRRLLRDFWLPDVIVLDTVSAAIGMGDENSSRTAQGLMLTCRRLMKLTRSSFLLVHHTGKNASNGMRGHSALLGGVETSMLVSSRRGVLELEVRKQRDRAKLTEPIRLRLQATEESAVVVPGKLPAPEPIEGSSEQPTVVAAIAGAGGEVVGKNALLNLIGGRKQNATHALEEALEAGVVAVDTSARPHAYRLV